MLPLNKKAIRILVIGSEITQGYLQDSNTKFISSSLYLEGIKVNEIATVPDDPDLVKKTLNRFIRSGDFVITTGGLGPTDDDRTVDILCKILKVKPIMVKSCQERVKKLIFQREKEYSNQGFNRILKQCRIPEGAEALSNKAGLAPGIFIKEISTISLPGFPVEIKSIWPHALKKIKAAVDTSFSSMSFSIWGIPESLLYDCIKIPAGIDYGNHSLPWGNRLFLKAPLERKNELDQVSKNIKRKFQAAIVDDPLEKWFMFLKKEKLTFSTIESCTGGLGAKLITDFPGASLVYPGSLISYSNEVKIKNLHVKKETLKKYGAVSRETAREMALGGSNLLGSDITISITGIAGPSGGTKEKPVGTVYYGIFDRKGKFLYTGKSFFPFGRERFRNAVIYNIFLSLYHRYIYFKDETRWLSSSQGKNFLKENIIASTYR